MQDHFPLVRAPGNPPANSTATQVKEHKGACRNANTKRILDVCSAMILEAIAQSAVVVKAEAEYTTHQAVANAGFAASPFLAGMREQFAADDKDVAKDRGALFDAYLVSCADYVGVPRDWVHNGPGYGYFKKGSGAKNWYDQVYNGGSKPGWGTKDEERGKYDKMSSVFFGVKVL